MTTSQQAEKQAERGVGALPAGSLSYLCDQGRTLAEIARLAGVSRQAVHARIRGTVLEASRKAAQGQQRRTANFTRWRRTTRAGQRLATAVAEIREHCPDLEVEWRWNGTKNVYSWQVLVEGLPLSVYSALSVTWIGQPKYHYHVYRADLQRPGVAYLVRTGDHRCYLYLGVNAPKYVWFEAVPPWRRSQNIAPDFEWRSGGGS